MYDEKPESAVFHKTENIAPPEAVKKIDEGIYAVHNDYKVDMTVFDDVKKRDAEDKAKCMPDRTIHDIDLDNTQSFIEFTNEYKTAGTKIFYNNEEVRTIFNYPETDKTDKADSKAVLKLVPTEAMAEFMDFTKRPLTQKNFLLFLKKMERFLAPTPNFTAADLLTIAISLKATKKIEGVEQNTKRAFSINIETKAGAKEDIEIPQKITFNIPPFTCSEITGEFTTELFIDAGDNGFEVSLMLYNFREVIDKVTNEITKTIIKDITDVKAFRVQTFPAEQMAL